MQTGFAKEIVNILNRFTGAVVFSAEIECKPDEPPSVKLGLAVKCAVKAGANLAGANLAGANLADAYLADAYLARADLASAYLAGAYLARANLADVNLARANLAGAYLAGAYLARADLASAYLARAYLADVNLAGVNLAGVNLARAYLADVNLAGVNLAGVNLAGAYLADVNLADVEDADYAIAQTRILPDGELIGWKKLANGSIAKLRIPADARRSHAFGRKCRAEFADVIEGEGVSRHDNKTKYAPGLRVTCQQWDENWQEECAGGIHFFITRIEAERY